MCLQIQPKEGSHMATTKKGDAALEFFHPAAGLCRAEIEILAVRWKDGTDAATREKLLTDAGLTLLSLDAASSQAPLLQVNQTDGLSWVRSGGGQKAMDP
jgi:hypothetical protein